MTETNENPTHDEIAALAQKFWEDEGQPEGKAEEHWERAQAQLRGTADSASSAD